VHPKGGLGLFLGKLHAPRIASKGTVERTGLIGPHEFGMLMIVIGLVALLLATLEHRSAIHALQAQYPETNHTRIFIVP
jgi:hypothetical protein